MATFKIQLVRIGQVYLDNINPRHDPIDNEPQIIGRLIAKELVKPLARDIAARGTLSPLERLAVIPHPKVRGAYISVEGNRRVCALKLLSDPDKAPSEADRRVFRDLAKKMRSKITDIDAVIFEDRKEARPWMSLRHEGALGGVGIRTWRAFQKARFDRGASASERTNNPNAQASLLLEYGLERGLVTRDEHDSISLTTLTRFLKSPVFRNTLGLATSRDTSVNVPQNEFDLAARRFLRDAFLGGKSGVHSRTDRKEREAYAHKLRAEGVAPTTRLPAAKKLDPNALKLKVGGGNKAGRASKDPDKRRTVIPSDFSAPIREKVLRRIYKELRDIDSVEYSFAAAYLLRAFIERTATQFCKRYSLGHEGELHAVLGRCATKLAAEGLSDNELKPLRVMASERDSRISPHTLGAWLHGSLIPTSPELARFWETIEGNLKAMLERLK